MKTFFELAHSLQTKTKIHDTIQFVLSALAKLLNVDGKMREGSDFPSYSASFRKFEDRLFSAECNFTCSFIRKHVPSYKPTGKPPPKKCGTEGCAYFINDDVVMKCTFGDDEALIAHKCKGRLDIVPVIDVAQDAETKVYLILMNKLLNDETEVYGILYTVAYCIENYFDSRDLKTALDPKEFAAAMSASSAKQECRRYPELAKGLFDIIVEIGKLSGFSVHRDVLAQNLGMTRDRKIVQKLDLGYPDKLP